MDPQKLSQLDPKLREAYQRVMGTPLPPTPPAPNPVPAASEPQPAINPPPQAIPTPQPAIPTPPAQTDNFIQMNSEAAVAPPAAATPNFTVPAPEAQTVLLKKKNGMLPILFVIVALIFIAIYTLFWTKIFNLRLPFLP